MNLLLAIGLGGALGALSRHYMAAAVTQVMGGRFPYGILVVNVLGGLLMGIIVEWLVRRGAASAELRAFLAVGLLGGFTTFSAFSLDIMLLIERGQALLALLYAGLSVVLAVGALAAGMYLVRLLG